MAHTGNLASLLPENIDNNQWRIPFALTVGLHLCVFLISFLPSSLFNSRPELPKVITINLFNAVEPTAPKPAAKKKRPPKIETQKKKVEPPPPPKLKKPVQSLAESPPPPPALAAPKKITSLAPRKLKKKTPPPVKEKSDLSEKKRLEALERIQARITQKREEEKLKHELAKLRKSLHTKPPQSQQASQEPSPSQSSPSQPSPSASEEPSSDSSGDTELMDMALKRYYIAVSRRIHNHWVLPEIQNWDESLEALIVVVIHRDGSIIKSFFEKRSENSYFNQFVEKTIQASSPLPQFPSDLKKNKLEIGLRFHPSGLY